MNVNILVVSQYYYPEQFRINDICAELVKRGHRVTVLTGQPNYPDGEIFQGYEKINSYEEHDGVQIMRCKIRPRHKGNINLLRNYISFAYNSSKKTRELRNDYDIVYVYQLSPILLTLPALKLKKRYQIPVFLYCCDIWPESVRDRDGEPMSIHHPIYIVAKCISKYIYNHVDKVGVKCNQFIDYLHDVCEVKKDKCCLIYEHAENSYLSISEEPIDNGCYDFMFLGNIGFAQNCDYIVKAVERIKTDKKYKIHFVGNGSGLERLQRYVNVKGLENKVIFHGWYPVSKINQFYEIADCCILTLSCKTAIGLTPPAKLSGYMAASRPVIAAATGATEDIIKAADCGICVDPEDADGLLSAMQYAIEHQEEFREKGKIGRNYFKKNFTLDKHVDILEKELISLVDRVIYAF